MHGVAQLAHPGPCHERRCENASERANEEDKKRDINWHHNWRCLTFPKHIWKMQQQNKMKPHLNMMSRAGGKMIHAKSCNYPNECVEPTALMQHNCVMHMRKVALTRLHCPNGCCASLCFGTQYLRLVLLRQYGYSRRTYCSRLTPRNDLSSIKWISVVLNNTHMKNTNVRQWALLMRATSIINVYMGMVKAM